MDIRQISERNREIFRTIVESYLDTGEPIGSRSISRKPGMSLSAATIRNVMADLEDMGLLEAPHTSAGRRPSEYGLRLFVDGMMQLGDLNSEERATIDARCQADGRRFEDVLADASAMLSGLTNGAGLVVTPKVEAPVKHIEFVPLGPTQALAIMILEDMSVENRVIDVPLGMPSSTLVQAGNFLNHHLKGRSIEQARTTVVAELAQKKAELDKAASDVVEKGLAVWSGGDLGEDARLIVRGRANLLADPAAQEDLERVKKLFDDLENKRELLKVLEMAREGEGVRIFIGSENKLFSLSGSSVIATPYMNSVNQIVGVIGVIGPTRLNYARVIPTVDYTARMLGRLLPG